MDEKSEGRDLTEELVCEVYKNKSEIFESTEESVTSTDTQNNNVLSVSDKIRPTCESPRSPSPAAAPSLTVESRCKIHYHSDGTVYVFESVVDNFNVERFLSFFNDQQQNSSDDSSSLPTTLCYIKLSQSDDDALVPSNTVFTYKIIDTQKFLTDSTDLATSSSSESYANKHVFFCLLCNGAKFSTALEFLDHVDGVHELKLSSVEREVIENVTNYDGGVGAILHKTSTENETSVSILSMIRKDFKSETDKTNANNSTSPIELATTLMLASKLSASRFMQIQQNNEQQQNTVLTVPRCNLHPDGKSAGVECPKCDLILGSSRSLGGHITMMHSRNSCKTLKCPKCNWHYKYQETLEIHMNEKHNDAPTSCVYCVSNTPHPRLGRGEQWSCGYKPYRCDVCKYSTTTKGNLAIHMQSDKHLNNVQEIQQGKLCNTTVPIDSVATSNAAAAALIQSIVAPAAIVGPPTNQTSSAVSIHANSSSSLINNELSSVTTPTAKTKPSWRCDVCNYETNVMRNLRIHTTSEKHTQNLLMLHQSVKNFQQQQQQQTSQTSTSSSFHLHPHTHRPLVDLSFAASTSGAAPSSSSSATTTAPLLNFSTPTCADDVLSSSLALNLQNLMFQSVLNDGKLFQCCICMSFACDTLAELISHSQNTDRSRPNESDVTNLSGNYICNLCHYKTHLKANFQLHTKTDKHLQRLQLVNHVREGGPQNEVRMKYLNPNNPIQLRCVACNEFSNSFHKLQMHLSTNRHRSYAASYEKVSNTSLSSSNNCLYCTLCDYVTSEKHTMLTHLHSERHNDLLNQILPVIESSDDIEMNPLNWIEIRDKTDESLSDLDEDEDIENDDSEENYVDVRRQTMTDDAVYCCGECNFCFDTEDALELHVQQEHQQNGQCNTSDFVSLMCPLCKTDCGSSRERLECHLTEMHKVPSDGVERLLNLLPTTSSSTMSDIMMDSSERHSVEETSSYKSSPKLKAVDYLCNNCNLHFDDLEALFLHQQLNVDHLERQDDESFLCWANGCKERFNTLHSVQNHYRNKHNGSAAVASFSNVAGKKCNSSVEPSSFNNNNNNNCKCAICGRTFVSNILLNVHVERSHGAKSLFSSENKLNPTYNCLNLSSPVVDSSPKLNGNETDLSPVESKLTIVEEHSNHSVLSETNFFNDSSRPFKCDKCKLAFSQQIDLTLHNRTLQHRHGLNSAKISEPNVISSTVNEKFYDPNRPFKCDVCKESFTQKNILLVHYNSVSHLNKKSKLECQMSTHESVFGSKSFPISSDSTSSKQQRNSSPSFSQEGKKYKCNICKAAYTSGSALDVHLRSDGHKTQVNRLYELLINGEVDFNQPLIEQPTDNRSPTQKLMSSMDATFNPFLNFPRSSSNDDVWQHLFNVAPSLATNYNEDVVSNVKKPSSPQPLTNLEQIFRSGLNKSCTSGKTGLAFRKMLENYGFEVVMQYNEAHHRKRSKSLIVDSSPTSVNENEEPEMKKSKLSSTFETVVNKSQKPSSTYECNATISTNDVAPPEMAKCKCSCCEKEFSSVWVLKAHMEQVHKCLIPVNEVEKVSEEFKQVYDKKFNNNSTTDDNNVTDNINASRRSLTNTPSSIANDNNISTPTSKSTHMSFKTNTPVTVAQTGSQLSSQMAAMAAMSMGLGLGVQIPFMGVPFNPFGVPNPYMPLMMTGFDPLLAAAVASSASPMPQTNHKSNYPSQSHLQSIASVVPPTQLLIQQQAKRARTRITDDQLKVLREYFDINNSPTEEQIEEMSRKSALPQKVIKHWFRNTLFKERQRSKDSPYNFNIPPSLGIDLEEYEKTGEAKIIPLVNETNHSCSSKTIGGDCGDKFEEFKQKLEDKINNESHSTFGTTNGVTSIIKQEQMEVPESTSQEKQHQDVSTNFSTVKRECNEFIEEDEDEYDDSEENELDLSGAADNNNCFNKINAHETFCQLAAVGLSAMQIPAFRTNGAVGNSARVNSPLSSLLSQHAALQGHSSASTSDLTNMIANALSPNNQITGGGAGRRANRTRFTEWQVKTLQEFFEKNAYPKDDDLEVLSNKLNLSPRVIVVWFQNARQKARKIYENLPAECDDRFVRTPGLNYQCKKCRLVFQRYYELIKHQKTVCFKDETKFDGDQSPPLHQHHHHHHQTQSRLKSNSVSSQNKSVFSQQEQNLITSHQKSTKNGETNNSGNYKCNECGVCFNGANLLEEHAKLHSNPLLFLNEEFNKSSARRNSFDSSTFQSFEENSNASDFLAAKQKIQMPSDKLTILDQKYITNSNPSPKTIEQISCEIGLSKNIVSSYFQHAKAKEKQRIHSVAGVMSSKSVTATNNSSPSTNANCHQFFNKRCPFCGILFHSKLTMESHLHSKHSSQCVTLGVDIANLPDAEEVPTITTVPLTEALWNAAKAAGAGDTSQVSSSQSVISLGMVPSNGSGGSKKSGADLSSIIERLAPSNSGKSFEESPLDLSRSLKQSSLSGVSDELGNNYSMNSNRTPSNNSNEDEGSFMVYEENDDSQSFYSQSPSNSPQHQYLAALARPQKRFRTRLTPQQIRVMKFLFTDFKTPTMSECEILGNEMGLHKRVVQVWFQNARAKERKAKLACGGSGNEGNELKISPPKCFLCDVVYTGRMSMQDHSFSKGHIEKIRKAVEEMDDSATNSNSLTPDLIEKSTTAENVFKQRTSNVSVVDEPGSSRSEAKVVPNSQQQTHTQSSAASKKVSTSTSVQSDTSSIAAASMAQNLLPYMYAAGNPAYYASMMMPTGFGGLSNGNLFYDPNVHGTPVSLLQIPSNVMQQIMNAMQRGKDAYCRFTQDGKNVADLPKILDVRDRLCVGEKDLEVGWACRTCVTVFQAEALFVNHQLLICHSKDRAFKLIQTHYDCKWCNQCFGTQAEFIAHCESSVHQSKTNAGNF